ncbi:hypothetical protein FQN54_004473 [Arachnomyces sp. PD_36]|nr:hypothetical protein FQN54_004473 [Arachnomyces sp. PD_36]
MPADALWIFFMACNVYLTIFYKYDASNLKALEWKQIILAYGLPFVPAFVLLFIKTESRSNVYGSAILWCWIRPEWDYLRLVTFYGPAWLVIFMTSGIYMLVGKEIFDKRRQLRHLSWVTNDRCPEIPPKDIVVYSEITKTSVASEPTAAQQEYLNGNGSPFHGQLNSHTPGSPYTFSVNSGRLGSRQFDRGPSFQSDRPVTSGQHRRTSVEANRAAWAYTKCASLFFLSLVVTWVPSTINRVYAFAEPDANSFPLNYFSSFVLPLQGFWNCIIYIAFSFPACKELFFRAFPCIGRRMQPHNANPHAEATTSEGGWTPHIVSRGSTESTMELNTV